jgi:hypothetical protein
MLLLLSPTARAHNWVVVGKPTRANVSGGPWVLSQGAAAFPTPNPGVAVMQPYYQALTTGDATNLVGYFDYRRKDVGESVVAATSSDGGKTWVNPVVKLSFLGDAVTLDDGEGHPFVLKVGGHTYLYTIDRSAANVDVSGLFVREITAAPEQLSGIPDAGSPGSTAVQRTVGLTNPDGIIGVIPGTTNPVRVMYLSKDTTAKTTTVYLADTVDGINFTNQQAVSGLNDSASLTDTKWIGPRGTVIKYPDGGYGLFFSGGINADGDADSFHYVGYAESRDLKTWTVVNGLDNPLLSKDASKDPVQQPWYAGRVYAPSVTMSADGCTGTLAFSGYKTQKPKDALDDYRQIGVVTVTDLACSGGHQPHSGCNMTPLAPVAAAPAMLVVLALGALMLRRRRR